MQALRSAGRLVPAEVRVATRYDGVRAREERPALTAVDLQLHQVASLAIDRLMNEISGTDGPERTPAPPPHLVIRDSTLPPGRGAVPGERLKPNPAW